MSDLRSFGMWLRHWRKRHDLTQAELAQRVGCALGTLRNIETDSARPSKQLAARLARTLGIPEPEIDAIVAFARGTGPEPTPQHDSAAQAAPPEPGLPAQLTGLIGRDAEVAAVQALLARRDVRLVTLTGPGGTGKTRVAVEAARSLGGAFPDGITFVDLAAVDDPARVLDAIAQALGVRLTGTAPRHAQLADALRSTTRLLLVDNFEQVAAAAPELAALLSVAPQAKALVTSRVALGVAGEYEWPVPPLALPDRANLPALAQLTQYESVRLFAERARAAWPDFRITADNAPAVAEICVQLDGLPLAIELAAARIKLFEPQALLQRLDNRLSFLTGGRDRPTRQQTIRNAIAWSHQLLTPSEQQLFEQLAVFVGGATLPAIEAVCGFDATADAVVDNLAALVNHSLVRRLPAPEHTAETRFGMLETIREFAVEQLSASFTADLIRQRHAWFFRDLAEEEAAQWSTRFSADVVDRLRREHDNLRAALGWALLRGERQLGLRLADALWRFWRSYGYGGEGRAWLEQLLAVEDDPEDAEMLAARARALYANAWLASDQHEFGVAARLLEESLALRRTLGHPAEPVDLFLNASRQARVGGDYGRATELLETALAQHRAASPALPLADLGQVLRELGLLRREQGDFERAAAIFEEGLALHRAAGDHVGVALALLGLCDVARDQGHIAEVRRYGEHGLAIFRELEMGWAIGFALNSLARGALHAGDLAAGRALIDESVALFRGLRSDGSLAEVLTTQSKLRLADGDTGGAHAAAAEALRHGLAVGPQLMVAAALETLAGATIAGSHAAAAARMLAGASRLRAEMGTPVTPADRAAVTATHARARAALGAAAFARGWAAGTAQPLEQLGATIQIETGHAAERG